MTRVLLLLILLLPSPVWAQEAEALPQLVVDFPETEAIPGQSLSLRLTVLVPSFMPKPPVWPSLEAPNLLVRLPSRSTNPVSERVNGETWAGISRHYRISPMVPGQVVLPPQEVLVTWQDLEAGEARQATLSTGPIGFAGVVPEGAEELDPFIAAADLSMMQEIEGAPDVMVPGDSLKRQVTVEVQGVSPMFLPQLLGAVDLPGVAAYPDEPRLSETDDRGALSGSRMESVTYLAEAGGGGALPEITLDWYDTDDGVVKTASAPGFDLRIDGPPPGRSKPLDPRRITLLAGVGLLCLGGLWLVLRHLLPRLASRRARRREAYLASEPHAWRELMRAISGREHAALRPALDLWAGRVDGADPRREAPVRAALLALGAERYGGGEGGDRAWSTLRVALEEVRPRHGAELRAPLPPLNPGGATQTPGNVSPA
ncbi:BatD family protein [Alloyangia pacifica]|uniref:Oxygen tolerance n=1 Tax=Alloyangia pacifica TaxID=311180 RepID=A0A1I6P391_9RHOB|nr:BatD family protein [Alloyangia pacifica]SDH52408.1 Oxygen tolerance [Alloyangia pacifica]SFS34659.1 Oxygen tolerance [Alloyangia pacifica]